MTTELKQLLAEAADAARDYTDSAAAVQTARRARRRRRTLAVPLLAAVVALVAFVVAPALRTPEATTPAVTATFAALPDGPVGAAAMIYSPCARDCAPMLMLTSGAQYVLPQFPQGPHPYTLSPDGRWLGFPVAEGFRLRNLTDGTTRTLDDDGPGASDVWVWSPDSARLLMVRHTDGLVTHFESVVAATGARSRVVTARSPVAVLDDGTVLYWQGEAGRSPLVFAAIRRGGLQTLTTKTFDVPARLRAGESPLHDGLSIGPDDSQAMLTLRGPAAGGADLGAPVAVLVLNLGQGRVAERVDLPAGADLWVPSRLLSGSVRGVQWAGGRTQVVDLDRALATQMVVATLAGQAEVVLPGDGR
jgi:hypothetical protein